MDGNKWYLDDPMQASEAINYLYSLPDDEFVSENEADSDAEEELNGLDKEPSSSNSNTPTRSSRDSSVYSNSPVTADYDFIHDVSRDDPTHNDPKDVPATYTKKDTPASNSENAKGKTQQRSHCAIIFFITVYCLQI